MKHQSVTSNHFDFISRNKWLCIKMIPRWILEQQQQQQQKKKQQENSKLRLNTIVVSAKWWESVNLEFSFYFVIMLILTQYLLIYSKVSCVFEIAQDI